MQASFESTTVTLRRARTAVALALGAGALLAAATAQAQIVHSGPISLVIPATTAGLYINVITGVSNISPGSAPGWDINPWSSTGLGFFSPTAPVGGAYQMITGSTVQVANLSFGAVVGAGSWGSGSGTGANAAQWNLNSSNNLFGFRFIAEPGGTTHFGWARVSIGSAITTRSIVEYAYESTPGVSIQAGVIPEPGTYALMGLGLLGVALAARRQRKG
jgi:hypothetical protein